MSSRRGSSDVDPEDRAGVGVAETESFTARRKKRVPGATHGPHGPETLEELAGHVLYERHMWNWAAHQLNDEVEGPMGQGPSPERNALIECYLLHLRNLIEFFRSPGQREDDVVATDYLSEWSVGQHESTLSLAWEGLNKRLNHITTARADAASWSQVQSSWQAAHDAAVELWQAFEEQLDPTTLEWFQREESAS